jgi:hypothetical protein
MAATPPVAIAPSRLPSARAVAGAPTGALGGCRNRNPKSGICCPIG